MKSKSLILMIVSLGFGLIAAVGISQVMGRSGSEKAEIKTGKVIVPIEDLEHHALLSEENCKVVEWPVSLIPEDSVASLEEVQDMATKGRMIKEMPILKSAIIPKNNRGKLPIPPGQKVASIKVSAADIGDGLLQPGDKVDVVGIFKIRKEEGTMATAKTFLKNITVFAVAGRIQNDGTREVGGAKNNSIVSVLVTPAQAEMLILVQKEAELTLTLRGEEEDDEASGIVGQDFLASIFNSAEDEDDEKIKKGGSMTDHLQGLLSRKPDKPKSMRVWLGSDPVTYTFGENGELPKSDRTPKPQTPPANFDPSGQEEYSGNPDYARPDKIDRGLDEDQYPGE